MQKFFKHLLRRYFWLHFRIFGRYSYFGLEWIIRKYSLVGDRPFYDKSQFPWVKDFEGGWTLIRKELDAVVADLENIPNFTDVSPDQKRIDSEPGKWKTFFLVGFGHRIEANAVRCPETMKLLEKIPELKTAFFSILAPGKYIPPHRGVFTGLLRYHLGLIVPEPEKIRIRVKDQIRHWYEGDSLIFDDTYEHEVWNESTGTRVVLFIDFTRPMKGFPKRINDWIIDKMNKSPLVREGLENMEKISQRKGTAPVTAQQIAGS